MLRSFKEDPSWKHDAPAMPRWRLERDLARARGIYSQVFGSWVGKPMTQHARLILADEMLSCCGDHPTEALRLAIQDSLSLESDFPLSAKAARKLSLQLVHNLDGLVRGIPIPRFISVTESQTWVPLEILSVDQHQEPGRGVKRSLSMLVIGGPLAGFEVAKICPCGYLVVLANDLGYSFRRPYQEESDLVGLWLAGLIEPSSSQDLQFDKYWLNSAMIKHNSALVKRIRPTEKEELEQEEQDA